MQDFASKRSALFACLDDASKELKGTILDQGNRSSTVLKRSRPCLTAAEKNLSFMRGKESIFKKPERPITRCLKTRQTPDYQMNPHKWKKYSLSDVDISDHTNTTAALAFLREMDEQNDAGYESQSMDATTDQTNAGDERKIEFKRSCKISRSLRAIETEELADAEIDKPKLKGSKLIMPEYVVGQRKTEMKKKKEKKSQCTNNSGKSRAAGTLKLSHLQDIDDDDDGACNDGNKGVEDDEIVGER